MDFLDSFCRILLDIKGGYSSTLLLNFSTCFEAYSSVQAVDFCWIPWLSKDCLWKHFLLCYLAGNCDLLTILDCLVYFAGCISCVFFAGEFKSFSTQFSWHCVLLWAVLKYSCKHSFLVLLILEFTAYAGPIGCNFLEFFAHYLAGFCSGIVLLFCRNIVPPKQA